MCIPDEFRYISMKIENIFAASFAADIITSKWGPDGFVSRRHREERQQNCARKMKIRGFVNAVSGNFFAGPLAFLRGFGYAKGEENASAGVLNRFRKTMQPAVPAADKEEAFMRFGHFDDARREYVITTPQTPLPWINYLGSEDFFSLVSNTAGGYSFYRDARLRRLTRYRYNSSPLDMDGHHIYIKDGGTVWNPGWQPTKTPLDRYSCRHGLGYTILEGEKDGICAAQELFVPKGDACELDRLTLTNRSDRPRELDVFSYVEFCLWDAVDDSTNFQRNFSTGEMEVEPCAIYHKTEYRERRDHYAVFWSNTPVTSFDTARDAFCGVYGGPADPQAVRAGHCSGSIAHGWAPVGALHIHVTLAPGEEKKILFGLGYIENPQEEKFTAPGVINKTRAHAMMARYADDAQVDAARAALADHWESLLSGYRLQSGEEKLDRMEPLGQLLRERHRPRHGLPGQLSGPAWLCAHHPSPGAGAHSGHCRHSVRGRQRLPSVSAPDQKGQSGCGHRLQRRPAVAHCRHRRLPAGDRRLVHSGRTGAL